MRTWRIKGCWWIFVTYNVNWSNY